MSLSQNENLDYCTYEEWMDLDIDRRTELIEGQIYMMADPTGRHQEVLGELFGQLWTFLRDKPCRVYPAPFSVRLDAKKDTALEPDIVVLCAPKKRQHRGYSGAPDMVVEILSPSNTKKQQKFKYQEYQRAGVSEYWFVDPDKNRIDANRLINGKYVTTSYFEKDIAPVQTLPGCEIDLSLVFRE